MAKASAILPAVALSLSLALAAGCRIDEHKGANGDSDNVKIATPFGGMSVKTDEAVVEGGVGLSVYPGAVLVKKDKDKDNGAADVNLNFGSFHLGVKALSYKTPDAPDKVMAFYRKDMTRFGAVILCRGNHAVGTPDHTQDGLTCDKDHGNKVNVDEESSKDELKAGSKLHQHIVAIDPDGSGTKIGLVALDLPSHLGIEDDRNDKDKD
jgi:hypothetical protein